MTARLFLCCVALIALLASVGAAQDGKRVVPYTGTIMDAAGVPRFGPVGITISLYADREDGEPLWRESQTVQLDNEGRYTLLIGATEREGLPLEVFTDRKAQWLGIQEDGETEQPRILLITVPYALKAADADTVGGRPLSAFVLYEDLEKAASKNIAAATIAVQNGVPFGRSGISGTVNAEGSRSSQAAQKLQLSGSITPLAYNETGSNTWFGEGAGASITTGKNNSLFGQNAGSQTSGGTNNFESSDNSFFGYNAGSANTKGFQNSFFGRSAGQANTTGQCNSFFGFGTGGENTTGSCNSFFGQWAGGFKTAGDYNSYFGYLSGAQSYTGSYNSFFGHSSGEYATGDWNSFFGDSAGYNTETGAGNAFFGANAGYYNTGDANAFFGSWAGYYNNAGFLNSFFGDHAGFSNTTGELNTLVGNAAGVNNTTGHANSFFGSNAGSSNGDGDNNSTFGYSSDVGAGITNATAIGYRAKVTQSNSLVLGSINGVNGAFADTKVGIGTTTPDRKLQIASSPGMNAELHIGGAGDGTKDVYSGMGPDLTNGPALNFGYSGYSFGRSSGFINIRPDASATPPNPSLRFMTANQQRMIITNSGDVGIGTVEPKSKVHAEGGAIYVGSPGEGIILKSPSGLMCVKLTIDDVGGLVTTPLACP
jgi:hypothetical protein